MRKQFFKSGLLAIFTIILTTNSLQAQTSAQKANFMVSIARNIEWPEEMRKEPVFRIAVYSSFSEYKELIDELMDKSVYNKNIEVLNIYRWEDFRLEDYHIAFLPQEKCTQQNIKILKSFLKGKGTLILTEKEGSLDYGSAINFIQREGKLHFEASPPNLADQGLKATTNLMNFAYNK